MIDIPLLRDICREPGAPGYENPVRKLVMSLLDGLVDDSFIDPMGNLIAVKKGLSDQRIMIAAHLDEISFIVTYIDDNGFIRFQPLGGFDPKTLTAQRVIIHGRKDVIGVMGTKPIHVMKPEERKKMPEIEDFFIDTGMSVEEVKERIRVGDVITRERELIEMGLCVNAKSLDNRVSVFILIETLKALKGKRVPYDLYAVFTVQEEVGLRGATAAASHINPQYSIVLDVTLAYDLPGAQAFEKVTSLGRGAAIKVMDGSTICDARMVAFMRQIAEKYEIPHQMEILPAGGTDAAAMQRFSRGGSITGGISIPTRYLHQVIEMAHIHDIDNCIRLLTASITDIDMGEWTFK